MSQLVGMIAYRLCLVVTDTGVCVLLPVTGMDIVSEVPWTIHTYRPLAVTIYDTPQGTDVNR
jgi:hypothetical protein